MGGDDRIVEIGEERIEWGKGGEEGMFYEQYK